MTKRSFKLRNVAMIACLAVTTMFASCDKEKDDMPGINAFSFTGQRGTSVIDKDKHTVKAIAECGTNIAALTPSFTLSPDDAAATVKGERQTSGKSEVDFSSPVVYTVTSSDGKSAEWTVSITLPGDCPPVNLKAATIHYVDHEGNNQYLCFDNYGKQRRFEAINRNGDHGIFIYDEINGNYHVWSNDPDGPGWVPDEYVTSATTSTVTATYLSETHQYVYNYWDIIPNATKTTETIAGQTCTVYTIPADGAAAIFGVWDNTVLLRVSNDEGGLIEAVTAKKGCPDNAFTKTISINWE